MATLSTISKDDKTGSDVVLTRDPLLNKRLVGVIDRSAQDIRGKVTGLIENEKKKIFSATADKVYAELESPKGRMLDPKRKSKGSEKGNGRGRSPVVEYVVLDEHTAKKSK